MTIPQEGEGFLFSLKDIYFPSILNPYYLMSTFFIYVSLFNHYYILVI